MLHKAEILLGVGRPGDAGNNQGADHLVPFEGGGNGQRPKGTRETRTDQDMAQFLRSRVKNAGFLLQDYLLAWGVSGEIIDFTEVPGHQRLERQLAVTDRHQPEEVTGERLRQLGEGPFDYVGNRHIDIDVPSQLVQNFEAAVLLEDVLV